MNMKLLALLFVALSLVGCLAESSESVVEDNDVDQIVVEAPGYGAPAKDNTSGSCGNLTQTIELVTPDGQTRYIEVLLPCTNEPYDRGDPPPDSIKDPGSEKEHIINEEIHT